MSVRVSAENGGWTAGPEGHPRMGGEPHYRRDRHFKLEHLKLDLSFDEAKGSVRGTSTLTLAPLHDGLTRVTLDAVDLAVRNVRSAGKSLAFEASGGELRIDLARPARAGQALVIEIAYTGTPKKGLFFIKPDKAHPKKPRQIWSQGEMEDNRHWFPCYDASDDKCTSEVILTVADRYTAVSNGRLVGVRKDRKKRLATFHWRQDVPHVTYLVAIAVGEFDIEEESFGGAKKVPVQYYVPKGRGRDIRPTFARTVDVMRFFSEVTGVPYPYEKYAQVVVADFTFGGMENTSMTLLTERCLVPKRLLDDTDSDSLIAHELAHQWWGDLVTTKSWAHLWLNEGFASYFDPLYFERSRGADEFHLRMKGDAEAYFAEFRSYRRAIVTNEWHVSEDMFDRHTYCKGGWVLHMLRGVVGDDHFWKGIRHYIARHARRSVETADLKIAFEEATGRSLDCFFDQWLMKGGHPAYDVSWTWDDKASVLRVTVAQTQKTDDLTPLFRMPVEIVAAMGPANRVFRVQVEKANETFAFQLPERPKAVYFDPAGWVLKTVRFKRTVEALLYQLAHAPTALCRAEAAEALAQETRTGDILEGLSRVLEKDPFYGVRQAAAQALGSLGGAEAAGILARALKQKDPKVRRSAAEALGKVKPEHSGKPLLAALRDPSDLVRAAAVASLGKSRVKGALPVLARAARQDSWNDVVRGAAAGAAGELADPGALPMCRQLAAYGRSLPARNGAATSLVKLWRRFPEKRGEIEETLRDLIADREYLVRRRAAELASGVEAPAIREALAKVVDNDIMCLVRRTARMSLDRLDKARGASERVDALATDVESLKEALKDAKARIAALEAARHAPRH